MPRHRDNGGHLTTGCINRWHGTADTMPSTRFVAVARQAHDSSVMAAVRSTKMVGDRTELVHGRNPLHKCTSVFRQCLVQATAAAGVKRHFLRAGALLQAQRL